MARATKSGPEPTPARCVALTSFTIGAVHHIAGASFTLPESDADALEARGLVRRATAEDAPPTEV